jgi:hypothetical protein
MESLFIMGEHAFHFATQTLPQTQRFSKGGSGIVSMWSFGASSGSLTQTKKNNT